MNLELGEYGIEEAAGITAFLLSLLFIKVVRVINKLNNYTILIFGIPPWRNLISDDLYSKRCIGLG